MKLLRKLLIPILAAACLLSVSFTAAFAEDGTQGSAPQAEGEAALSLLLPETYEQYLELTAPSDIAVSDEYIAIADMPASGNSVIYLLDKAGAEPKYRVYTHSSTNKLSSLNLYKAADKTYLFFLDTNNTPYYIDCSAQTLVSASVDAFSAYSMIFSGNDIFYAKQTGTSANIFHASVAYDGDVFSFDTDDVSINQSALNTNAVAFSVYNGTVYLSADKTIYTCTPAAITQNDSTEYSVSGFAIIGTNEHDIIYASQDKHLYFRDADERRDADYSIVKLYANDVYITADNSILRYSLQSSSFTNYLIGKYSDRENRLNAASDLSVYGGNLVVADTGNDRLSLIRGGSVKTLSFNDALLVCAGSDNVLAVSATGTFLSTYNGAMQKIEEAPTDIVAVSYAFGVYYLIDQNGDTCAIDGATGAVQAGTPHISDPVSIAADLFGNIYVLNTSGHVNRYTVQSFLSDGSASTRIVSFAETPLRIFTDYEGNVFGLTAAGILAFDADTKTISSVQLPFADAVFSAAAKTARSAAFDFESGEVYVLSDGFIVKADLGANAPASLKNIAADGLHAALHGSAADTVGRLVTVPAGSVAVQLDAGAVTQSAAVLPYADYERVEIARTGVKICDTAAGTIVAFYEYTPAASAGANPEREYTLCLILGNTAPAGGYYTAQSYGARTTNDISLLRFPTMHVGNSDNAIARLAKGTGVTVLGKVSLPASAQGGFGLDTDYAYVSASVDGEKTVYGYIPLGYTVENSASSGGLGTDEFVYRNVKKGESITLWMGELSLTLSDRERVKMYGEPNEEGEVYVTYTDASGTWSGYVPEECLYEAPSSATITLIVILLVTAAVLASGCYLLLRKPPMLQE